MCDVRWKEGWKVGWGEGEREEVERSVGKCKF